MKSNRRKKSAGAIVLASELLDNNTSNGHDSLDRTVVVKKNSNSRKEKKIKFDYHLKKLKEKVSLTESQSELSKKIDSNIITFITGPAGTAKSFTACYTLLKALFEFKIEKIIFTKPIKESGENLGFLPGDISQKLDPYVESFKYLCKELIGEETLEFLEQNQWLEYRPLAYMRGITFNDCGLFLDEAQNSVAEQLMLYISRLGKNSKMVIAGDITQRDIEKKKVVMPDFINMMSGLEGITLHEFERKDIVRHPLLVEITDRYEQWKEKRENGSNK